MTALRPLIAVVGAPPVPALAQPSSNHEDPTSRCGPASRVNFSVPAASSAAPRHPGTLASFRSLSSRPPSSRSLRRPSQGPAEPVAAAKPSSKQLLISRAQDRGLSADEDTGRENRDAVDASLDLSPTGDPLSLALGLQSAGAGRSPPQADAPEALRGGIQTPGDRGNAGGFRPRVEAGSPSATSRSSNSSESVGSSNRERTTSEDKSNSSTGSSMGSRGRARERSVAWAAQRALLPALATRPASLQHWIRRGQPVQHLAFGSNLSLAKLYSRVPGGMRPLAYEPAVVPGHRLAFNLAGVPLLEPTMASIEPQSPSSRSEGLPREPDIHGLLLTLRPEDYDALYISEGGAAGLFRSYLEYEVTVVTYAGVEHSAVAFRSNPNGWATLPRIQEKLPSRRYLSLIIQGAKERGLDQVYIAGLEKKLARMRDPWNFLG